MAFFPRNFYNNDNSFTPLFRLLDDFDHYSRRDARQSSIPHWQPKFDVRETDEAYELHGEFPGIKKEDVHIEFTEPHTMLIRGRTERTYTAGTPPAGLVEGTAVGGVITEGNEEQKEKVDHHAKVEDEPTAKAPKETIEKPEGQGGEQTAEKKPADKAKYWLTERSIGEFSRSFNFPTQVDQENVTANFEDGILNIVVPKAKKHESRRITVN